MRFLCVCKSRRPLYVTPSPHPLVVVLPLCDQVVAAAFGGGWVSWQAWHAWALHWATRWRHGERWDGGNDDHPHHRHHRHRRRPRCHAWHQETIAECWISVYSYWRPGVAVRAVWRGAVAVQYTWSGHWLFQLRRLVSATPSTTDPMSLQRLSPIPQRLASEVPHCRDSSVPITRRPVTVPDDSD
jgi:hypothetical protein